MTDENSPWIARDHTPGPPVEKRAVSGLGVPRPTEKPVPGWLRPPGSESGDLDAMPASDATDTPEDASASPPADQTGDPTLSWEAAGVEPPGPDTRPRPVELLPEDESRTDPWVWVSVIAGIVLVVTLAGWASFSRQVDVPDVTGTQPAEAAQILNDMSLRVGSVSEVPTDSVAAGSVVSQMPEAGSKLKPEGEVALVVAIMPDQPKAPDVVGRTRESAEKALVTARLLPKIVGSHSASVGEGTVIGQVPAADDQLAAGSTVAIVVSLGPAPVSVTVPQLTGLTEAEAKQLLAANRLRGVFYRGSDMGAPADSIMDQAPPGRTAVPYGSVVQVLVSGGPGQVDVTVPDVVGQPEASATSALTGWGLQASVQRAPSDTVAAGAVISQIPSAGWSAAKQASVGLLVSSGPAAEIAVPQLVGTDFAGATNTVTGVGLRPVLLTVEAAGRAPGQVFAQFPEGGAQLPPGYPVVVMAAASASTP